MNTICANLRLLLAVLTGVVAFALPAGAQEVAGTFQFVIGDVQVQSGNAMRPARRGDPVREGETIISGANGEAQLRMVDDAYVAIRRDTQLRVDEYRYSGKNDASERGVLSLVKGTFRALTGLIVRNNKQNFTMKTAVSTIGIRGTGNITNHNPDTNTTTNHTVSGSHGVTSTNPVTGLPVGATIITNPGVTVEIRPGQPAVVIPTPRFILAEASTDPKGKKADPKAKEAPRTDNAVKAENETRETTTEAPKDPAPPPAPEQQNQQVVREQMQDITSNPTSTSEQQLLQANLRTQIEGAFARALSASGGLATLAATAQAAASNASASSTTASLLAPANVTAANTQIATAQSLISIAPSIAPTVNQAVASKDAAITQNTALAAAQILASNAALAASTASGAVPTLVTTAQNDFTAAQTTYIAAKAALDANNIVLAQTLLQTLITQSDTAVASAGTASSQTSTATSSEATAAAQLAAAKTALSGATSSASTAVSLADNAINAALGNVLAVAAAAGTNATAIGTINTALGGASGTTAQQAFDAAGTANTTAQANATTIAGIAAVNSATAASNLASVTTLANTAQGQVTAATTVNTANSNVATGVGGTDFRDSQAAAALASMNTANTPVQGALTTATSSNTTVGTQSTNLTTAKASAVTQSGSATTAFTTSTSSATTTFNTLIGAAPVDAGATNANQSVSNLLALANAAAAAAQTAANLGTQAGALTAQAEYAKTQAYLALAQQVQTVIQQRDAVVTADGQLATLLASANAAKTAGDAAVTATTTALTTATTNATTVVQQSAIAQYNNPTIVTANRFGSTVRAPHNLAANSNEKVAAGAVAQPNITYVLDGSKNLVEIKHTGYVSAPGIVASVSYADADVKFAGGTAFDNSVAFDPSNPNYMALGRWQGGTITADDSANGAGVDHTVTLDTRSAHWAIAYLPPAGYVQSLTGTTTYTKIANTSPTDASGNVGTLNNATLSANFVAQTVNAGVNVTVASKTLDATAANLPIVGNSFQGGFGTVTCPSCTTTYVGGLGGTFAGQNAAGAGFGYDLWTGSPTYTDLIQGVVGFSAATPPLIAPKPAQNIATAYLYGGSNISASVFRASGTTYSLDGTGNLLTVADDPLTTDSVKSEATSGGAAQGQGATTPTAGGTVLTFGRWQGGTVSGTDFSGAFPSRAVDGAYHWIKGPVIAPFFLPSVLTGTASFTAQGGSVTDQAGVAGTLDLVNSTFSVNFTQQSVAADIRATTGANTWRGVGTGIQLGGDGQFFAGTGSTSPHNNMAVEFNGLTASTFGTLNGTLMGNAADAVGVSFAFGQGASNRAAGVVGFTGAAQPQNASFSVGIIAAGKLGSALAQTTGTSTTGTTTLASLDPNLVNHVDVIVNATSRVLLDDSGYVAGFDASVPVATPIGCTGTGCTNVTYTPARLTSNSAASFASIVPPGTTIPATPGLTLPDNDTTAGTGSGTTGTGISWGRYTGYFDYADRIGGGTISTALLDARGIALCNPNCGNWHGIWVHNQSGPPVLPLSGTFPYTMIGGTRASDSLGNLQSLANANLATSATLTANFTNLTVNTSVNAIVGPNTWAASASNLPIVSGTYFQAEKNAAGGNLSVTCTGACTGLTAGRIVGAFTGNAITPTPNAAPGAMLGFSLNAGGVGGVTMQGVKAFSKNPPIP